jgi:3-isopropylmalate/(R)-2-methylmalate dehydratase large subunit
LLAVPDHNVPTSADRLTRIEDPDSRKQIEALRENARAAGITLFDMDDIRQGIVHVTGPENGLILPGITGAFGAIAFGIGTSEVEHALATQTLWQKRPREMRITVTGTLGAGVSAKDVILAIIAKIGSGGGTGYAIEYAGEAVRRMSMEERLTICNMTIEAGGRFGMVAPDETTFSYLSGRPAAPGKAHWEKAVAEWNMLPTDDGASFDREESIEASRIDPQVTWGTSPEDALPVGGVVPDPANQPDPRVRERMERAMRYMDLRPGMRLTDIPVDKVFIGSCTNARIEDLRIAAKVARGKKVANGVTAMVVPGSGLVKTPGVLHVSRDEPGPLEPRRALRFHLEPELRGTDGAGGTHPLNEPDDGGRSGCHREDHRRSGGAVSNDRAIRNPQGRGDPPGSGERGHRCHHSRPVPQDDQAHRAWRRPFPCLEI